MKQNFVAAIAGLIVRMQHGLVLSGLKPPALQLFRTQQPAKLGNLTLRPRGAFALDRIDQRSVGKEQVISGQWRRLIEDLVGRRAGSASRRVHCSIIFPWSMRYNRQMRSVAIVFGNAFCQACRMLRRRASGSTGPHPGVMRFMPVGAGIVGGIFTIGVIVIGLGRFPLLWYFFVPAVVMVS